MMLMKLLYMMKIIMATIILPDLPDLGSTKLSGMAITTKIIVDIANANLPCSSALLAAELSESNFALGISSVRIGGVSTSGASIRTEYFSNVVDVNSAESSLPS